MNQIRPGLVVQRTRVLRPIVSTKSTAKAMIQLLANVRLRTARSEATRARTQVYTRSTTAPDRRMQLKRTIERALAIPDQHIGWLFPAVFRGLGLVRRFRPSVIYSTSPPHSTHLIAVLLGKLARIPVVVDFRDPWTEAEWRSQKKGTLRANIELRLERIVVGNAARVILNTQGVNDLLKAKYSCFNGNKFLVIPNGFDPSLQEYVHHLLDVYGDKYDSQMLRLCHAGSAWGKRDLRTLAEAIKRLKCEGHHVVMEQVGPVDDRNRFSDELTCRNGESPIQFVDAVPHQTALRHMAQADVLVLLQPDNRLQIPGKVYEMLPFQKPILTLANAGATADLVTRYGLGPVVDPNNVDAIAQGILTCERMINSLGRFASSHELAIRDFDGKRLTGRLAKTFDQVCRRA